MKAIISLTLFAVLGMVLSPTAASADPVDNPQFVAWSKCAVGSSVTYQQTAAGTQAPLEIKKALKEKADDHVTLEGSTKAVGAADVAPQIKSEAVPAKLGKSPNQKTLPNETIQVGDKKIDCKVSEVVATTNVVGQITVKLWTSDEVPGGLVKLVGSTDSQGKDVVLTISMKAFDMK